MKGLIKNQVSISRDVKVEEIVDAYVRSSDKKFRCNLCSKNFSSKHCLKEHGYTHSNERPYSCNFCRKIFKHASQLSLHKKTHRVKADLSWPKLTDLLKNQILVPVLLDIVPQIVSLPPISKPQDFSLPKINILF
ncbi:hypothetical protein SteCoe_23709 [Stentor coeruleus]|uniref:C2H2-type domain-containing protein n=1 Tax=Stentor coeruleus TaxID=5963 RepID=A0A1R2BJ68_9CILI|nr:hypothetical protein SteCoe_23709 [Stentor coeruleus]